MISAPKVDLLQGFDSVWPHKYFGVSEGGMRGITLAVAVSGLVLSASQALAWGDMFMGDGTHNPNSMPIRAYNGANYCPTGLQPVVVGGVICCGVPDQPAMSTMQMGGKHD